MKKRYVFLSLSILMLISFIVFTVLVKTVDVQAIGPVDPATGQATRVGFADINAAVHSALPLDRSWYAVSTFLGYLPFILGGVFALNGLVQLIRRKSFLKVDFALYMQGAMYILIGICYLVFEMVVINFRPVILEIAEWPEASYPSSDTLLAVSVFGCALLLLHHYFKDKKIALFGMETIVTLLMVWGVIARLMAGVHWATDIFAGILLGLALMFFFGFLLALEKKQK